MPKRVIRSPFMTIKAPPGLAALRREHTLPHGQMYEPRNDSFLIEGHCSAERTSVRHL